MEAIATKQPFNETQLFILQTFAMATTKEERDELTSLYLNYIQRKLDVETDKWWSENEMTTEKFEQMFSNAHFRTPYNC